MQSIYVFMQIQFIFRCHRIHTPYSLILNYYCQYLDNNFIMSRIKQYSQQKINPEEIRKSTLNNSTAKMQYSFPKSDRFDSNNQRGIPYYDLPSINEKRATTFGKGKKTCFEDLRVIPPPNSYIIHSQFEKNKKNGISFAYGRQTMKNLSVFKTNNVPGPGSYHPKDVLRELSFTMKIRPPDNSLIQKKKMPGPADYTIPESLNKLGKYPISKYPNSRCSIIGNAVYRLKTEQIPGPNYYNPKVLNQHGERSLTEAKSIRFSNSKRQGIYRYNNNPGPGQYNHFSEFS